MAEPVGGACVGPACAYQCNSRPLSCLPLVEDARTSECGQILAHLD